MCYIMEGIHDNIYMYVHFTLNIAFNVNRFYLNWYVPLKCLCQSQADVVMAVVINKDCVIIVIIITLSAPL